MSLVERSSSGARAIAASSRAEHPEDAVLEVAARLRDQGFVAGARPGTALVFSTPHHAEDPRALSAALGDALGNAPFVGWVGASAFHGLRLPEGGPGLSVLVLEDIAGYARATKQEGLGALVAASLVADAPVGRARFVSAAGEGLDSRGLLGALDEQGVPLVGAVGVPGPTGLTSALAPDLPEAPAAALLSLSGCQLLVGVAQGARPIGPPRRITRVEGNLVYELDGRPALEAMMRDLPTSLHGQLPRLAGALFAGLGTPDGATFLMRNVLGLDPRAGIVAVAGEPREGSELLFALRDARAARTDIEETLHAVVDTLDDRAPLATVMFTCVGRNEGLLGSPLYDVGRAEDLLGQAPVVGLAGGGELCTWGAASHLFSYAAVVAVLLDDEG